MKNVLRGLSIVVLLGLFAAMLIGCGNTAPDENGDTPSVTPDVEAGTSGGDEEAVDSESFKIGIGWFEFNDPTYDSAFNNIRSAVEAAGGELVVENTTDMTAEGQINTVQKLISMGVDGVIFTPLAQSVIPKLQSMCENAGVYFSMNNRMITDPDIKAGLIASEYFAGCTFENEEETAYKAVLELAEKGVEDLCVISGPTGDTASDARERGIERAVSETGINVLTTIRDLQTAGDVTSAVESFVAAFPDMDGIFVSYTWATGAMPALQKVLETNNLAGEVIVGRIDFDSSMAEYFADGQLNLVYGGQMQIDPYISTALLVNKVMGYSLAEEPLFIEVSYMKLTSEEEALDYFKYLEGDVPVFTTDEAKEMILKKYNPDIDGEAITSIVENFSLADVIERHQDIVE